jgi:hypothetical protein
MDFSELFGIGSPVAWSIFISVIMLATRKMINMAMVFRKDVVSREDLAEFKKSVRADLRYYKEEISDIVIKSTFKIIDEKLEVLDDFKKSFIDIEKLKIEIQNDMKKIRVSLESIDVLKDNMKSLQNKITRMDNKKEKSVIRDVDKR